MSKPRIAFWFRYGPGDHAELFHALPGIIETLSRTCEVHCYGLRGQPVPEVIRRHARLHLLPFRVNRASMRDKFLRTILWLLALPWIGLHARLIEIRAVYIDETIPLTGLIARMFFGRRVALTVADFFTEIYLSGKGRSCGRLIQAVDLWTWRRLPLLFTRARATRDWLAERGIDPQRVHPVYDPCDFNRYHPLSPAEKAAARARLGFAAEDVVLVHHGILHPNKGNDRILRALAPLKDSLPRLRLLLVGDGPEMAALRRLAAELGLTDHVLFTGWLESAAEVNAALNATDINLVMRLGRPSDDFHMTGALVHGMACGLPILAARLAGVAEVVHERENGLLFDPHTLQGFPEALGELYRDGALRETLGRRALADARHHFELEKVIRKTVEPLLVLVGNP